MNKKIEAQLSKIILESVLNVNIKNFDIKTNLIIFNNSKFIGTTDFAILCKQWAYKNEFSISSELGNNCGIAKIKETEEYFLGENEAVAVIIAVHWIMTNHFNNKGV